MLEIAQNELAVVQRTFPEAEELFSPERIARHVRRVAQEIVLERAREDNHRPVKLVVVLDGAMPYGADLSRDLATYGLSDIYTDTIQLSRYGETTEPSQTPKIIKDLLYGIQDEDVIVIEDILDGGLTLAYLCENILRPRQPHSLKITALVKREGTQVVGTPESDYPILSFADDGRFAIGYGLDFARGQARHYRGIYLVPRPKQG